MNPSAFARLLRSRIEVVPDPVEPDPFIPVPLDEPGRPDVTTGKTVHVFRTSAPSTRRPCGHCNHAKDGHGRQYGALAGWHDWWPEAPSPNWMRTESVRDTSRPASLYPRSSPAWSNDD